MGLSREEVACELALIHAKAKFERDFLARQGRGNLEDLEEYNFMSNLFYTAYLHFMESDRNLDRLFGR